MKVKAADIIVSITVSLIELTLSFVIMYDLTFKSDIFVFYR
jgi:hypothetical protein